MPFIRVAETVDRYFFIYTRMFLLLFLLNEPGASSIVDGLFCAAAVPAGRPAGREWAIFPAVSFDREMSPFEPCGRSRRIPVRMARSGKVVGIGKRRGLALINGNKNRYCFSFKFAPAWQGDDV